MALGVRRPLWTWTGTAYLTYKCKAMGPGTSRAFAMAGAVTRGAAGFGGPGAAPPGQPNKNVGGRRPPTFGRGNRARRRPPGRPGEREGRGENKEKAAKPLFFIFII